MGGRGSGSGIQFSIPNGNGGDNFQKNALMERPPKDLKEAIGAKGAEKSMADAMKNSNPYYSRDYSEYSENCQRCVVAYELRRRGYDVEAQPTYAGDKWPQSLNVNGRLMGRWRGAFRHAKTDSVGVDGNNAKAEARVLDNLAAKMREYGNGARAIIRIGYRGTHMGHVFNVENRGGQVSYVDAQTGQRYLQGDMRNLMKIVDTRGVTLTRTDNLRISARAKEFVWHKDRNKR